MEGVRLVWAWEIRERETQSSVVWSKARLMYQTAVGGSEWCLSLEIFALLCHRTKLLAHPHSPHHLVELFVGSQSCYRIIFGAETGVFARVWCLVFQSQFPADQSLSVVLEGAEWHFSKSLFAFPTLHMNGSLASWWSPLPDWTLHVIFTIKHSDPDTPQWGQISLGLGRSSDDSPRFIILSKSFSATW